MITFLTHCSDPNPESELDLALAFTVVGGLWAVVTFIIEYLDNRFKRKIELLKIITEYNKDLRIWADKVIDLMTEAIHMCDLDPSIDEEFFNKRHKLRTDLSSWTDKGRFFLPNTETDNFGKEKPSAYRGFRDEALSHIVECYILTGQMNYRNQQKNIEPKGSSLRDKLVEAKRKFVSSVQGELDPKKFENDVKQKLGGSI